MTALRPFGRGAEDARLARTIWGTSYMDAAGFVYVESRPWCPRLRRALANALDTVKRKA